MADLRSDAAVVFKLDEAAMAEIQRRLEFLSDRAAVRVLLAGARMGAAVVKRAAASAAPVRSVGRLRRDSTKTLAVRRPGFLKRRIIYRKQRGRLHYRVGPAREAFYGAFAERGASRTTRSGRPNVQPARPWLRPAFERSANSALAAWGRGLERQLIKEVQRGLR